MDADASFPILRIHRDPQWEKRRLRLTVPAVNGRVGRFIEELSRRRVPRVVATYAIAVFGALQTFDVIVSALNLPHYLMTILVVLCFLGLPVTAVLAWVFDLTPEGVVRTPALARDASGEFIAVPNIATPQTPRSRLGLALGALAILLGIAGTAFYWQARSRTPLPRDVVAVLPFTVGGSAQYAYLREGVAELLATGISAGGALQTVDQRALVRAIKEQGNEPDDETGRALSRRFGAGLYVIGSVLEVKDRLRLHAQLFEAAPGAAGSGRPIAEANAEGEAGTLFTMVDEMLHQLQPGLVANGNASGKVELVALAERTTRSLPALKAFVDGEAALREGDQQTALHELQKAVAEDPAFALAQFRLAVVASWTQEFPLGRAALYHALQSREKLPPRERELIEAFAAYWRGAAKQAEAAYRSILAKHPDDAESWYQLGEVLFHDGPLQGHPQAESKSAFQRAAALEPHQQMYAHHLDDIAIREGDRAAALREVERQVKGDNAQALEADKVIRWERAWSANEVAEQSEIEKSISNPMSLTKLADLTLMNRPDSSGIAAADALELRAASTPGLPATMASVLKVHRAQRDCATGKPKETLQLLGDADVQGLPGLAVGNAQLALLPFFPQQKDEQVKALARLSVAEQAPPSDPTVQWHGLEKSPVEARRVHDYLAGRLSAALGDYAAAEKDAQALASSNDSDDSKLGQDLAFAVRAYAASAQGRSAEALSLLEQMSGGVAVPVIGDSTLDAPANRWLRAELLHAAGRDEEALRWFESVDAPSGIGCWVAPMHLRRGEILEKLGHKKEAVEQYRLFTDLWQVSDPEVRPMVDGARARMAALVGEHSE